MVVPRPRGSGGRRVQSPDERKPFPCACAPLRLALPCPSSWWPRCRGHRARGGEGTRARQRTERARRRAPAQGRLQRVGKRSSCGRVNGRWQPGTRRLSYWFFTHTQRAKNLAAPARRSHGAAAHARAAAGRGFRKRAKVETPACGPLRFRLKGASGLAVHGTAKPRAGHLSNLEAITAARQGARGDHVRLGQREPDLPGAQRQGLRALHHDDADRRRRADRQADLRTTTAGRRRRRGRLRRPPATTRRRRGRRRPVDDSGAPATRRRRLAGNCGDDSRRSLPCSPSSTTRASRPGRHVTVLGPAAAPRGHNEPIQFDDQGAVYFASSYSSSRPGTCWRYLNGKLTSYISDPNVLIDDYLVLGNGDVLLTGATMSTGARWVRRIDLDGHVHSVRSVSANFMRLFGDGNAYLGFSAGVDSACGATCRRRTRSTRSSGSARAATQLPAPRTTSQRCASTPTGAARRLLQLVRRPHHRLGDDDATRRST